MIPDCPGCNRKIQLMGNITDQLIEVRKELYREQKRSMELALALGSIQQIAKDKMWYPCSLKDHEAVEADQKIYCDVQKTSVWTDVEKKQ